MAQPNDEDLEELKRVFDECDPNGDGFIDVEEFAALLDKLDGSISREECQLNFQLVDADEDGLISFREFEVWWTG